MERTREFTFVWTLFLFIVRFYYLNKGVQQKYAERLFYYLERGGLR